MPEGSTTRNILMTMEVLMYKSKRTPKEVRGAILGTLLGDSYVTMGNCFGCEQVTLSLIALKAELLSHYLGYVPNIKERKRAGAIIEGRAINSSRTFTIRGRHERFKKWHKILYRTGSKQVTYNILKFLSPEGLALWVMDDGYMDFKKSSSTRNLRLCTDSYDDFSHKEMVRYFKAVWDIDAKIYWHKRNKNAKPSPRISFNAKNTQKIVSIIYKYMLPDMYYKIDMHYEQKTILSNRCSDEYREAHKYISQSGTLRNK